MNAAPSTVPPRTGVSPYFPVRLEPAAGRDITSEWQRCDLFGDGPKTVIRSDGEAESVEFLTDGLPRLQKGLREGGIAPDTFAWPPNADPDRAPYRGWQPLEAVDAAVYFGRDAQINRALTAIRELRRLGRPEAVRHPRTVRCREVVVSAGRAVAPAAARRPALPGDGYRAPATPSADRRHGLARSIHALRECLGLAEPALGTIKAGVGDPAQVRGWLVEAQHAAVDRFLAEDPGPAPPTIVLPVDQAEELLGAESSEEAGAFLTTMAGLLRDGHAGPADRGDGHRALGSL